jgi:hypothetical protein
VLVLIPVRYPLTDYNRNAIQKGLDLTKDESNPELVILHVNQLHKHENVTQSELRKTVQAEFGMISANYIVRDSFLVEEAILDEAIRLDVDHVVLSERRYAAWQQRLRDILDIGVDLESFVDEHLDAEIHIVNA